MEFCLPLAIRTISVSVFNLRHTCINESISYEVLALYMLSISNPDLTDKIYWCSFYDPLNSIWAHIHVLFMAMKTYFHDPWNSGLVTSFQVPWQFHGPWNQMVHVSWPIKFNFAYSWIFMAMKTDFHDPLISVLDHDQLFMALKKVFVSHEIIFMQN